MWVLWNDAPTKEAILKFVAAVSNPDGPEYVPPADRIASIDNDGTVLWLAALNPEPLTIIQRTD